MKFRPIYFIIFFALGLLSACSSEEHLYDKVGFDNGTMPNPTQYPNPRMNKTAPDYYYRSAPTVPQGYASPQPYYAPPPAYAYPPQPAYVPAPYQQAPASRYYSNPYDIPASPYGYQAYDADQYYVPPSSYYGAEQQSSSSGNAAAMRY